MQSFRRFGLWLGVVGAVLILGPILAEAAPVLMSGNLRLTTDPSVRRDYVGWGVVDVVPGTGTTPASMMVARSFFQNDGTTFRVFTAAPHVAQVTSSFTSFNLTETLQAGGGPGSFTFCPGVGNPVNPNCTSPSQATGGLNNFLQYTAGPNQFGGTFRVLQQNLRASVSIRIATNPSQFSHQPGDTVARNWPGGAPSSSTQFIQRVGGQITSNPVLGPFGSIQTAGPIVGTGTALQTSINTGFPATTGMVVHIDTNPSPFAFTLTGSDARTPAGSGQITLVGSGVAQASTGNDFGREIEVTLVPEPATTAMFAAGLVGLAGLYSQRRRLF